MQADFMKMSFEDNSFDAMYAIEATWLHQMLYVTSFLTLFSFTSLLFFSYYSIDFYLHIHSWIANYFGPTFNVSNDNNKDARF